MPETRVTEHEITVDAPAEQVYRLVADVTNWPQVFPPTVHVEYLERGDTAERLRIWAIGNAEPKTWTSRRELDESGLRVDFRQEIPAPPIAGMGGAWVIEPEGGAKCRVRLLHDYSAVGDDPENLAWIDRAVDHNSNSELAALKRAAEPASDAGLLLSFDDVVEIDGSVKDVYDFINEAQLWEQRLPHVQRVSLREDSPGLQVLEMDTLTKDGSVHTTKSVRVCTPERSIHYKQVVLPALLTVHTGAWLFTETATGVRTTSRHTVAVNEEKVAAVLGSGATVADAKNFVRKALSTNSLATLEHAKDYAESRRGGSA
ncbi:MULTISPECIES: aromatase/cyclase [Saccharothrix]|uniref:aromatase/cyclase n=1 Tax=Saccharothrix TaxID=2071 RepID=UPI000939665E|nr:aromatase/cyclase [Saccharothrix sp. CB00851]OKI29940.1 cyclase [Saccharothrix sp. CB00851]